MGPLITIIDGISEGVCWQSSLYYCSDEIMIAKWSNHFDRRSVRHPVSLQYLGTATHWFGSIMNSMERFK